MFIGVYPNTPGAYPEVTARKDIDKQLELNMFSTASSLALNEPDARQYWSVSSHISSSSSMYSAGGEENLRLTSADPNVCVPGSSTDDKDGELTTSAVGEDTMDSNPSFAEKFNTFPPKVLFLNRMGFLRLFLPRQRGNHEYLSKAKYHLKFQRTLLQTGPRFLKLW